MNLRALRDANRGAGNFRRASVLGECLHHDARSAIRFGEPLRRDDVQLELESSVAKRSRGPAVVVCGDSRWYGKAGIIAAIRMRMSEADQRDEGAENNRWEEIHCIPEMIGRGVQGRSVGGGEQDKSEPMAGSLLHLYFSATRESLQMAPVFLDRRDAGRRL